MKSILSNNSCEKKEKPFPKLMIATDGDVVLFSHVGMGTYVHIISRTSSEIGANYSGFCMDSFKDYEGSVCLSNE